MAKLLPRRKSTPTRQNTGTSYTSSGAPGVKRPDNKELGSEAAAKITDPVPDVGTGITASWTYKKMARDDASVRTSLRAGKAPVLGADFFLDPISDDPLDMAVWDLVDYNLFDGMTSPWSRVLEQILQMYESARAISVFETVWENREWAPKRSQPTANRKQYTMLRKMAFRPDTTIQKINYDNNGGPISVIQQAIQADFTTKEVIIPIEKAVIFTLNQEEGGLEGMPLLRSAYKHWWHKNRFYNIDGIQKERHGIGIPDVEVQPGASPEDWELAKTLAKNLRTNEFAHIVHPATIKISFAELQGQPVDVLKSALHHDDMIMKNLMVQFLNMGIGEGSGSRAAGATAMDMFLKAMRNIAGTICDAYNLYVIPPLVTYNFNTDRFPKLKARNIGETKDLQMFAAAMRNLVDVGAITVDEQTEAWLRDQLDMPALTTPWKPREDRPGTVRETVQLKQLPDGQIVATAPTKPSTNGSGNTSPNGGAGNVGKSPSSGAV